MKVRIPLLGVLAMFLPSVAAYGLTLDFVTVGDPGNPADQDYDGNGGKGAVAYIFDIGRFEVTLNQYTEFLNAVADSDPFGLYNSNMTTDLSIAGILRSGGDGSYSYSVLGDGQRPVTYVSWNDAARFTNWLHNGQPNTGSETAATTEQGAYTLNGAIGDAIILKNPGAQYWIPSIHEWYKAAYYQPFAAGGDVDGYWLFPMTTNDDPFSDEPPGSTPDNTRVGNFFKNDFVANGYDEGFALAPAGLTPVGAYTGSGSYYGTFDQGGNVYEWNDGFGNSSKGYRGGSWTFSLPGLQASFGGDSPASTESFVVGFRVAAASVPEPNVGACLLAGTGWWLMLRRRKPPRTEKPLLRSA